MMALIRGKTLRGYTLATNILKNLSILTKENIQKSTQRLKDSNPLFTKNIFKTTFFFFPRELDREI